MRHEVRSVLPGYGVAGVSTAVATLAQFPLRPLVGSEHPYWFFYVAVLVTAWHGGLRRALLALALGALSANYFFLPPAHSLVIAGTANQIGLALYLLVALVGALLIEALRQQRPALELLSSPAAVPTREPAAWTAVADAQRRLSEAQRGARALAEELKAVRGELARSQEEVRRQQEGIDELTQMLQRRPASGALPPAEEPLSRLPIAGRDSVVLLRVAGIDYAERRGGRVFVRANGTEYPAHYTLAQLETLLPPRLFCRIHGAYLVNLDRVRDLVFPESESYEIRLVDGQRLPVDRRRSPELRRRLGLDNDL